MSFFVLPSLFFINLFICNNVCSAYICRVSFDGYDSLFDEYILVNDFRDDKSRSIAVRGLVVGAKVNVNWGPERVKYTGTIIPHNCGADYLPNINNNNNNSTALKMSTAVTVHREMKLDPLAVYHGPAVKIRFVRTKSMKTDVDMLVLSSYLSTL